MENADWYVIHTKPKQEFRALEQLECQGYTCFLPTLAVEKIARGKVAPVIEPLFARYLFIRLDKTTSNWLPIRSTRGVSRLVVFGNQHATVPDDCVEALRSARPAAPQPVFQAGQQIAITSGALAGLEGVYDMPDGEARALVLIEMMSRTQRLAVPVDALRKVA